MTTHRGNDALSILDGMDRLPLTALLLDDSESVARQVSEQALGAGFYLDCRRIATRDEALVALKQDQEWDIIIAGRTVPVVSSIELLMERKERGSEIPVIILAEGMSGDMPFEMVRAGAHDCLQRDDLMRLGMTLTTALRASRARRQARHDQQRLRELLVYLDAERETERVHLAREVHDELGGMLTASKLDLRWLQRRCGEEDHDCNAAEKFSLLGEHLDSAINTVRHIITKLRPSVLDDLGLVAAIEWQLNEFGKSNQLKCRLEKRAAAVHLEEKSIEVVIFRIFQESLSNVLMHANASEVVVRLITEDKILRLEVEDNGKGISEENKLKSGHYGIFGMNERALSIGACLEITAGKAGGTRISLKLPL